MISKNFIIGSLVALVANTQGLQAASTKTPIDIETWNPVGNANWEVSSDLMRANSGNGFLVSTQTYTDFEISLDFRSGQNSNSGIFIRCADPVNISDKTCYEINIFDHRLDPSGRTGSIVNVAPPRVSINTEGQWNTYEVSARGDHLQVRLNGVVTVDTHDGRLREGPIALQFAAGDIQFRNVAISTGANLKRDIVGVWDLVDFQLEEDQGNIQPWCDGAFGTISYFSNYMSVAINCVTNAEKKIFYSGPYQIEGHTVIHDVRNFSDPSLHQVFRRQVEMSDVNHLALIGQLGNSGKVIVSWTRRPN